MDIEEAIKLLESKHLESDIAKLSPKDRLNFWASLKEFIRPKIQRSVFEPIEEGEFKILIERYESNKAKAHEDFPQPLERTEED